MANPIKPTPVIKGKDAVRFMQDLLKNEDKKVSRKELAKMKENYRKLRSIAAFN